MSDLQKPIDEFHPDFFNALDVENLAPIPPHLLDKERCSSECKGWFLSVDNNGDARVEKCDACNHFEYDEDAVPYAREAGLIVDDKGPCYVVGVGKYALELARVAYRRRVWAEIAKMAGDSELGRYYAMQAQVTDTEIKGCKIV
jgi:hypothetical protein